MNFIDQLDPELRDYVLHSPITNLFANLPAVRDGFAALANIKRESFGDDPAVQATDTTINTEGQPVALRIYRPKGFAGSVLPACLWIHGGGFVIGTADMDEGFCRKLAMETNAIVVSVDYRLAPEHQFPAGLNDAYATLLWMARQSHELGIDVARISVAGMSAGGAIAAGVCARARDETGPSVCFQLLCCPLLDDRENTALSKFSLPPQLWTAEHSRASWAAYLGSQKDTSAYAVPAKFTHLAGLPPTFITAAQYDVLRDGAVDYALRLMAAGVRTELLVSPGAFHGFESLVPEAQVSQAAESHHISAMQRAFSQSSISPDKNN